MIFNPKSFNLVPFYFNISKRLKYDFIIWNFFLFPPFNLMLEFSTEIVFYFRSGAGRTCYCFGSDMGCCFAECYSGLAWCGPDILFDCCGDWNMHPLRRILIELGLEYESAMNLVNLCFQRHSGLPVFVEWILVDL
jgi:hypothetical protein